MSQPIYYTCAANRKKEFALETLIYQEGEQYKVVKRPLYKEGYAHIQRLKKTYDSLDGIDNLKALVNIVPVHLDNTGAWFGYVEGLNCERILVESILNGDQDKTLSIINKFVALVEALPEVLPSKKQLAEYKRVFGEDNTNSKWVLPGNVDLNLDNLIEDSAGNWNLIDYEWVFDFPIPRDRLIQRFFFWFFYIRYPDIMLLARNKSKMVEVGNNTFVPKFIAEFYSKYFANMKSFVTFEKSFQFFVNGSPMDFDVSIFNRPREIDSASLEALVTKRTNGLGSYEALQQSYSELLVSNQALGESIQEIKSSRAYKLARNLQRLRNIFGSK
jgi:hypothetical protein